MRFTKRFPTGLYASPDGPVDIPATRVKHWSEQFGKMKAAGLKVPVAWGHVSTALPKTQAESDKQEFESTKYNAGYVEEIKQTPNGDLEFVFDVPDAADAAKLGKSLKDASPLILPEFRDGAGNAWNDVIGHFALCKQGVIAGQSAFEPVAGSQSPALACAVALSIDGKNKKAVRLAMPFEDNKPPKKDAEDQDDVDGVRSETTEADPNVGDGIDLNDMGAGSGEQTKTQLLQLLESAGLPIGDFKDQDDLVEKLIVALNVKKSHNEHDAASQQSQQPEKPLVVADGAPVAMSLEQVKAKNDPVMLSLFNHIESGEKATLEKRLGACFATGRCTPAQQAKIKPGVDGFRLSLGADGKPQYTAIHAQLDLLESMPAGAAWEPGQRSQRLGLQEVTPPVEATAMDPNDPNTPKNADGSPMTAEQHQAIVDRLSGRRFAKAK